MTKGEFFLLCCCLGFAGGAVALIVGHLLNP
jgi:hypothetical protein